MRRRGAILLALVLAGCAREPVVDSVPTTIVVHPTTVPAPAPELPEGGDVVTGDYLPGVEAQLFLPGERGQVPLVVMIPGGAWQTADPAGFEGLARHLAGAGVAAAPVVVRAAQDGVVYPTPVEDVRCALGYAVTTTRSNGFEPGPVIVLGHSSGAHLAALAALGAVPHPEGCPHDEAPVDALIGLAGTYDVSLLPDLAEPLFGVAIEADPDLWESGNPVQRAGLRPEVPVLLIHGDADALVPVSFTTGFADALEEAGHATTVEIVPGAGHHEIYSPEWVGDLITRWVLRLDD